MRLSWLSRSPLPEGLERRNGPRGNRHRRRTETSWARTPHAFVSRSISRQCLAELGFIARYRPVGSVAQCTSCPWRCRGRSSPPNPTQPSCLKRDCVTAPGSECIIFSRTDHSRVLPSSQLGWASWSARPGEEAASNPLARQPPRLQASASSLLSSLPYSGAPSRTSDIRCIRATHSSSPIGG